MEFVERFISEYGTTILYTAITAILGYIGIVFKRIFQKYTTEKVKQDVAKTVVQAIEQIYRDLHGEEKLSKAMESMSEMLTEKEIHITEIEMRMLIEAAVSECNETFKQKKQITDA